jgi:iron complex outermembrane receptor protein
MNVGTISNVSAVSYNSYSGDHYGEGINFVGQPVLLSPLNYYQNAANKTDLTAFNKFSMNLGRSSLTLDLQVRRIGYSVQGSLEGNPRFALDKSFLFFNPKIGWNIPNHQKGSFYIFGGLGHREPNRSDFVNEDALNKPKPERVYDIELGHSAAFKRFNYKTTLFVMYFQDQLIPTGALNSVGAPIRQNVNESYRAGLEGEFQMDLFNGWSFYTNQYIAVNQILDYTHSIPTYNVDYSINANETVVQYFNTTQIANSPSWISYAELQYMPWKNTKIQVMNKTVSSQYLDNNSSDLKSLPLYSFTNIAIVQKLYPRHSLKEITLNLLLNNILNANYIPRGYTYNSGNQMDANGTKSRGKDFNYYYPQAGFNVLMGVQFKL